MGVVKQQRIYLDSCIVIYLIEDHPVYKPPIEQALIQYIDSEFCVSPLVKMECLVAPLRRNDQALLHKFEQFFLRPTMLSIPEPLFYQAARLRADYGLKTPDALHLAIALYHGCDQLWTNDDRLSNVAGSMVVNVLVAVGT
jgi:predicted nucleic acid-binding protein